MCCTLHKRIERQRRSIDDFGKDAHVMLGKIDGLADTPEKDREIGDFIGTTDEWNAETLAQTVEISAVAAGQDDAIGGYRQLQTARNDILGHQRRDLHADIDDLVGKRCLT
jgi:hypothetical protein